MRLEALVPLGIAFVVIVVVLSLGSEVLGDIRDDYLTGSAGCNSTVTTSCGHAYNTSTDGLTGLSKISGKLGTIGLVLAIAVIIGVIITYMSFKQ